MAPIRYNSRWLTHYLLPTIVLVGSGYAFYAMGSRPEVPRRPKPTVKATVVEVAEVRPLNGPLVIETTGEVVPHRVLSISSEVEGRIVFKNSQLRIGEFVRAGETLIKIDPQRFALAVQSLEIAIEQANTGLERAQQRQTNIVEQLSLARRSHEILKDDVQRVRKLQQSRVTSVSEVGIVEKQELEARLGIELLQGQQRSLLIEVAEQELAKKLAIVQLEEAKIDQAAAEVKAPVSGIVIAAPQEEHSMVQVGDPLMSIEESGCLEVHCHLKLDEMAWVWNSQTQDSINSTDEPSDEFRRMSPVVAHVTYNVGGMRYALRGQLIRQHSAGLDVATRTVACRVLIRNSEIESAGTRVPLMTGMFVNVQVQCHPDRSLLEVPEQGIRTDGSIWLVRNQKLCPVPVKTILSRNGTAIFEARSSEVEQGDRVIVSPVANAREGLSVQEQDVRHKAIHRDVTNVGHSVITGHASKAGDKSP